MKRLSEISEAIDFMKTAKALEDYAKKSGGIDKESFQKVAAYVREIGRNSSTMVQNKAFTAMKKFIGGMDTDPRDGVLQILQKHGMFKNGRLMQESVEEITEFSDAQLAQLKKAYQNLEKINVASPTYKKLKKMIASMDAKMLEKVARAKVKFVSQIAARELAAKGVKLKAKDYMEEVQEAVSPAQQAAIAISKKERGEKPKAMKEDGHNDVESMKNKVKTAMSALQKMNTELGKLGDQDSLPTWWTNKVAVAVDKLDGMADYIDTQVESVDECASEDDFKPHMMYDPKTGKGYKANKYADHVRMDKMGYTHEKPEIKERKIDPADVDNDATDDDRKAADKNVVMQIRKAADLEKGSDIEFKDGKKGKLSQADAKKLTNMFNTLKRPADKEKFQKVVSKDLRSVKALLKRLGR